MLPAEQHRHWSDVRATHTKKKKRKINTFSTISINLNKYFLPLNPFKAHQV